MDKFTNKFIEFVHTHHNYNEHVFYIFGASESTDVITLHNIIKYRHNTQSLSRLLSHINRADKIILHGLFLKKVTRLLFFQPWLLRKCYWAMWGGDIYDDFWGRGFWKRHLNIFLHRSIIKRMGHLVTNTDDDVTFVREKFGARGKRHKCLMYPSNIFYSLEPMERKSDTINIMVGHSAARAANHLDAFDRLREYRDENITIYCPLSYGDERHAQDIARKGAELFGERFIPLFDFLSPDEYLEILSQMQIAIFANKRQHALGTLISLFGLGTKVFMRRDMTLWPLFVGAGVKVFDINHFDIHPLDDETKENNIERVTDYFSEKRLKQQLEDIFSGR